jgi:dihydrofolate synthase/folylpolyglutamate synthase
MVHTVTKKVVGVFVVFRTSPVVMRIRAKQDCFFYDKAKECNAEIHFASDLISENYPSDLIEPTNFTIKKQSCKPFVSDNQNEFVITPENTKSGLLQVVKNTGLQGRWQQLNTSPKVICDTHNKNGLEIVIKQIEKKNLKFYMLS